MQNRNDRLWDITSKPDIIPEKPTYATLNAIVRKNQTKTELGDYLHACAFSPALPTFQKAICNNNFVTWPGITEINFEKFVSDKTSMYLGHLDQVQANLQLTKIPHTMHEDFFSSVSVQSVN